MRKCEPPSGWSPRVLMAARRPRGADHGSPVYRGAMISTSADAIGGRRMTSPGLAAVATVGVGCVAVALVDVSDGPTLCPFKALTGLDCPLCGATRAAHHLLRGDIVGAMGLNLLFVAAAPFLLVIAFRLLRQIYGGVRFRSADGHGRGARHGVGGHRVLRCCPQPRCAGSRLAVVDELAPRSAVCSRSYRKVRMSSPRTTS